MDSSKLNHPIVQKLVSDFVVFLSLSPAFSHHPSLADDAKLAASRIINYVLTNPSLLDSDVPLLSKALFNAVYQRLDHRYILFLPNLYWKAVASWLLKNNMRIILTVNLLSHSK